MSMNEMEAKVSELRELRRMADDLAAEIGTLEDDLKAYMTTNGSDELHGPSFKITWKPITSSRLDSKALKTAAPELCERFTKTVTTRRFILAEISPWCCNTREGIFPGSYLAPTSGMRLSRKPHTTQGETYAHDGYIPKTTT